MNMRMVLAIVLMAMTIAAAAHGQQFTPESDFRWERSGNGVRITGFQRTTTDVRIPPQIQGLPVTEIGPSAFHTNQLTSVTIPNSVTSIGAMAFFSNRITSVTIPDGVRYIGSRAFTGNPMASVTVPAGATVNQHAFGQHATVTRASGTSGVAQAQPATQRQSSARQAAEHRRQEQRQRLAEPAERQRQTELAAMFRRAGNNTAGLGGSTWRATTGAGTAIESSWDFVFRLDGTFGTTNYGRDTPRDGTFRVYGNTVILRFDAGYVDTRCNLWGIYVISFWDGYYGSAIVSGDILWYDELRYVRRGRRW
ncbi:MAG: leucine-rich repeat domain-containing protein [Treponema sp.]|nr:leucine-rich repeat domain-containing protein [Treponema sp.]